jgi:uncharacterized protein
MMPVSMQGATSTPPATPTVAVAGLTARWLAESAAQAGWQVIALDLFGDLDTRRLARQWLPIGRPGRLAIDPELLTRALAAARDAGACAWIAGGGFEAWPGLLDAGGPALPRWGMDAAAIATVRDPRAFFSTLDRLGLPHPEVAWDAPSPASGDWLYKRASGSGGCAVRPAQGVSLVHPDGYFQRFQPGAPMSALCLADGLQARLVALHRQTVRPMGASLPFVFAGVAGPVDDPPLQRRVEQALAQLVPAFGLRGLLSLDFIEADEVPCWLEINPRPSASMQLHRGAWPRGLLAAHCEALAGRLPTESPCHTGLCHGVETLYATHHCHLPLATASVLAAHPHRHDLPAPGSRFAPGEPVCTVSARADGAVALQAALQQELAAVQALLASRIPEPITEETCP